MGSGVPGAHGHRHDVAALDFEVPTSARPRLVLGATPALVAFAAGRGSPTGSDPTCGAIVVQPDPGSLEPGEAQPGATVTVPAIRFVMLYLAHGLSIRTSTALAGTLFGVGITAVLGLVAVDAARLSGAATENGAALTSFTSTLQPR
ncbi:MAG: YibE/F family protein, partial [Terracoccus sp.]